MTEREAWQKLRSHVGFERKGYAIAVTNGRSKDAKMVFAALGGAYGGILRKMDKLIAEVTP